MRSSARLLRWRRLLWTGLLVRFLQVELQSSSKVEALDWLWFLVCMYRLRFSFVMDASVGIHSFLVILQEGWRL